MGKTAIAEGLAQRIANRDVPDTLEGKLVVALDIGLLIAGTKYRGEFEERLKRIMEEVAVSGEVILVIGENKQLQAKVNSFESKNQELRNLLAMQNERLEKIEQIALANEKDEKTAFSFLNVSNLFSSMRSFLISTIKSCA